MMGTALQLMMSTCTYNHYLTATELSRYLDVLEPELRGVLLPRGACTLMHDAFLRTLGIRSRIYNREVTWQLLGVGHLVVLGEKDCMELLSLEPNSTFW